MTGRGDKAVSLLKNGGAKLYSIANDPVVQAKMKKLAQDGQRFYRVATSPEAKHVYRQAAELLRKAQKK